MRKGLIVALAWLMVDPALAEDAPQGHDEIATLQQRLADAGCYNGALDGAPSAALNDAIKQCPDMRPFLRIETGMHTASINRIGVDAACSRAATASDDKTVRLWSLPEGKLLRTIRLPIGDGDGGKVYATALSPDGRWLAAGGWDAAWDKSAHHSLTLIDLNSGALRRLGEFEDVMLSLAFSADGARVAVGLGGTAGLRVFEVASGRELLADRDYGDSIYGLAFAADGALVVSSFDGKLGRYGSDLRQVAQRDAPLGKHPFGVAIDPSGRRLAVGYNDSTSVSLLDAVTLRPIGEADTKGVGDGDLSKVAWSSDGATLIAGGRGREEFGGVSRDRFRRFDAQGRRLRADIAAADNTLTDVRPCGDGFVFAAADPAFGRVSAAGQATTLHGPRTADMRDKLSEAFTLAADAATVRFGLGFGDEAPVAFNLAAATLTEAPRRQNSLAPARIDGAPVTDWVNDYAPKFAGRTIALDPYERSRALAVRPDAAGFALGADWSVRAFDAKGRPRWQKPGPGAAYGVDFSADGALLAVAYTDGTIRWLRGSDGQELLALFVERPTRRWIAWTPSGYYMASPGGEGLIGWHLNRGWSQLADFFPAARFSARFNRPDIVKLVLKTRDEAQAVRQANETAHRKLDATPIAAALPPVARIVSPAEGGTVSGDTVEVKVNIRSPSGLAVDRVDALIDGRPVEARGLAPAAEGATRTLTLPIPAHDFELAVVARAGDLVSEAAKVSLHYQGAAKPEDVFKPKLYLVAIGVSDYVDPTLQLTYAAADARDFAAAMLKQQGGLYAKVETRVLTDREATRANVLHALKWLDSEVTSRDIGMLMIAGHGLTDERGGYWFLPADAATDDLGVTAVSQDDLRRDLSAIAGKAMVFLDTCHANAEVTGRGFGPAGVDVASLVNDFAKTENGIITFAASQGAELSKESPAWRHGAFSLALIEGVGEGKADLMHKGAITVSALDVYITERVKALTEGHQHPVMSRPNTVPDFVFAMTK